ncbi:MULTISPECIES: GNAT family N-acetyltransferase [unclassified Amycolatopsis]|uniref:GNAT family N-acetyltransferase n=1 Tax=unclassified Amycolatopsis TaxID=2618356 RepID=UPI001C69C909|nr:GNAT family N-acetyltransferase [Amycolatopsis sp. DSM 110486]QYN22543.1 GNAT family N-acetyltransferase [Amycolatopsis sp. DSM 110486]
MTAILSDPAASVPGVLREMPRKIETSRLVLHPFTEEDRAAVVAIQTDPATHRFNPDPPDTPTGDLLFDSWLAHWAEHGFGYCAVREQGGAEVLGLTGVRLRLFRGERVLNLAYRFAPSAWGRGYAVEAASAAVEWAERELPEIPVLISVNSTNAPSLRVVERLGFTQFEEEVYEGAVSRHFRR